MADVDVGSINTYTCFALLCTESELQNMVETMYLIDDLPSVVRFPRGNGYGAATLKNLFGTELG